MANNTRPELEDESSLPAFALSSIARTLQKRKLIVLSVWVSLSAATYFVVKHLPSVFQAESLILVDSQKIPERFVSATVASDLEERITAIREQILASDDLKKIISDYNLYPKERKTLFEEEILELMRNDISIEFLPVDKSLAGLVARARPDAFRIAYQGSDPSIVAKVANRLTDLCVDQNLKSREAQAAGTSAFLDSQVQEGKKRLDDLEASVSAYKLKHNGELPQQEGVLATSLANLHSRLQANMDAINRTQQTKIIQQTSLDSMQAEEARIVAALQAGRPVVPGAPVGQPPKKQSEVLQEHYDEFLSQYKETFAPMVALRRQIEDAKKREDRAEQQAKTAAAPAPVAGKQDGKTSERLPDPPELFRIREQIANLTAQIKIEDDELSSRANEQKKIESDIDSYQARIERLPVREQEMAQLTRDDEMAKENYKSLLEKQTAAAMSLDMERREQSERFTVLDRATTPEKALKPKKSQLFAEGSAGALALGLLLGFVIELRKNVFLGEWELPEGTEVLARLPFIEVPDKSPAKAPRTRRKWLGRKKQLAAASSLLLCLAGILTGSVVNIHV